MRSRSFLPVFALLLLAACQSSTEPQWIALPVIDSLSPSSAAGPVVDRLGHLVSPAVPALVCVSGKHIAGGKVRFGTMAIASSSPGAWCAVMFSAPVVDGNGVALRGQYPVTITTASGTSKPVFFTRQ